MGLVGVNTSRGNLDFLCFPYEGVAHNKELVFKLTFTSAIFL